MTRTGVRGDHGHRLPVVEPAGGTAEATDHAPGPVSPWSGRQRLAGAAVAGLGVSIIVATTVRAGVALHLEDLRSSWQLIELDELTSHPLRSVWYLHTQPPLHNLVVGSVLRWSPFAPVGSLFALFMAALVLVGVLLTDILANWRVHPVVAGLISVVALANPNLLTTVGVASYEVPVTVLLVASLWWFQRYLQRPGPASLLGLAATLTALSLTRSLFHPVFALAVVGLAVLARRAPWRHLAVAAAVPVVLVGGWMVKNQVLFGTPTLSSWLGFNLQRGVTATMERDDVEAAVAEGHVSSLALQAPWGELPQYREWLPGCRPRHADPAVAEAVKYRARGLTIPNFNHECYLPLYRESQANAAALVRRSPGRYLRTRRDVLVGSFSVTTIDAQVSAFGDRSRRTPDRTWMDAVAQQALLPVRADISMRGWNLPLFGGGAPIRLRVSITLALLAVGISARGIVAAVRLLRAGRHERAAGWPTEELLWIQVAVTLGLVVLVGDLLEFGENGRFRSMVDPLLVALPLGALARIVAARAARPGRRVTT